MKQIPKLLPEYTIEKSALAPFSVKWEELQGWFIVPRVGEKLTWGLYEMPSRKLTEYTEMKATGKAEVHGIEGVEIHATQGRTNSNEKTERVFVAQLTDTHCRYLAESHIENGVRKLYTFLDSDEFVSNWGFGEDNCGNETNLTAKGVLQRNGDIINGFTGTETLDIVGRYTITIGGKSYDTVCVMDIMSEEDGIATEQYSVVRHRLVRQATGTLRDTSDYSYGLIIALPHHRQHIHRSRCRWRCDIGYGRHTADYEHSLGIRRYGGRWCCSTYLDTLGRG